MRAGHYLKTADAARLEREAARWPTLAEARRRGREALPRPAPEPAHINELYEDIVGGLVRAGGEVPALIAGGRRT